MIIFFKGLFHVKHLIENIEPAYELLKKYEMLVCEWQKAVNLVSKKDIPVIWERHILDSAQVYFCISKTAKSLVDLGSGGGFPGIVIAILNKCLCGNLTQIYLIESDNKKCVFLQEVSRILDLNVKIVNKRIECVNDLKCDVLTSRGLTSVQDLLCYANPFLKSSSEMLFLKGINVIEELKNVKNKIQYTLIPSVINKEGCILKIMEGDKNE